MMKKLSLALSLAVVLGVSPLLAKGVPAFDPASKPMQIEVLSEAPQVYYIYNFLSEAECDKIIELARPHLRRSSVIDNDSEHSKIDPVRTSMGMFFSQYPNDNTLKAIEKRIVDLTLFPSANAEGMQVLRYATGGEYKPHFDFFDPNTVGGATALKRGGQRVATLILYLNTPKKGGETVFPKAKLKVKPRKGNAVLFYNCLPNGDVDPLSMHGGAPVVEGEKWIATKWFHAVPFK